MMGFEPMTPCLQGRCSPSWATPPYKWFVVFSVLESSSRRDFVGFQVVTTVCLCLCLAGTLSFPSWLFVPSFLLFHSLSSLFSLDESTRSPSAIFLFFRVFDSVVGPSGLEPPTSCLSGTRSNLLSYEPMQLCGVSHLGFFDSRSRLLCSSYRCQHRTIFPHSFPWSIFATAELNFCVRNGNRWTLCVCDTDFFSVTLGHWKLNNNFIFILRSVF